MHYFEVPPCNHYPLPPGPECGGREAEVIGGHAGFTGEGLSISELSPILHLISPSALPLQAQCELAEKEAGWREKIEKVGQRTLAAPYTISPPPLLQAQSELVWRETEWQEMMAEKEEWQQKAEKVNQQTLAAELHLRLSSSPGSGPE